MLHEKDRKEISQTEKSKFGIFFSSFHFRYLKIPNADYSKRKHREASHPCSLDGPPTVEKQKASYRAESAGSKTHREVHRRELQPNRPGEPKSQTRKMLHSF